MGLKLSIIKILKKLNLLILPGFTNKINVKYYIKNKNFKIFKFKLNEIHKFCFIYNIKQKQFKVINNLLKNKKNKIFYLLKYLNMKLDIILYISKITTTIKHSKQLIIHGKIFVNNKQIKYTNFIVTIYDYIFIHENINLNLNLYNNLKLNYNSLLYCNINTFQIYILRNNYFKEYYNYIYNYNKIFN